MSKDLTIVEAQEAGFDIQAFRLTGDVKQVWVNPEESDVACFVPEMPGDWEARCIPPASIEQVTLVASPSERPRTKFVCSDAINLAISITYPIAGAHPEQLNSKSEFSGFEILVSETARKKLEPYVGDECAFIPVSLRGAPGPYYAMWVKKIVDAISSQDSTLTPVEFSPQLNPMRCRYNNEIQDVKYLFRLPQWKYFADYDFCTLDFVELVRHLELTGFRFFIGGSFGPQLKFE